MKKSKLQFKIQNGGVVKFLHFTLSFLILIFTFSIYAHASSFELELISFPVRVGDTALVLVLTSSERGETIFIADARFSFPRELLWAKSFTVAPGWVAAPGEGYNFINNGQGVGRTTAGFEGGISNHIPFGTLEFVAVGEGIAEVNVLNDSLILDQKNDNIFVGEKTTNTKIEIISPQAALGGPPRLFDIRLELGQTLIMAEEPLVARVVFQSFGQVPTPVDIFFTITDETGKIFTSFQERLVVETEAVFTKQFEYLELPSGDYTLHASTRYNVDVEDDFHAEFRVGSKRNSRDFWPALVVVILAAIIVLSRRKKRQLETATF